MTVLGLLIATAAAFAITERLKLTKSPVYGTTISHVLSPGCDCRFRKASIAFKLRHSDTVTIQVVDRARRQVALLVAGERAARGLNAYSWNGVRDDGRPATDGVYKVQLHLDAAHRTFLLPNPIALDTKPPTAKVTANRAAFSPDGDGQADYVRLHYTLSEPGRALVYLDGKRIIGPTHSAKATGDVRWFGTADGATLPPGSYVLYVGARDAAGNVTPALERDFVVVTLRYIALPQRHLRAVARGFFTVDVDTDARAFWWKLGARSGVSHVHELKLRAPATPGRYRLAVGEQGHVARAQVIVR